MLENKKIFVLGMARSGYEVAKLLAPNNDIIVVDKMDQDETKLKELETLNVKFIKSDTPEELLNSTYDLLIKNPAVFPNHPCVLKAENLEIPVVNEMEVAYHYLPSSVKIIGITGSNGKTTTTTLIYNTLKRAGLDVLVGGNIGTPLSALVKKVNKDSILVLEISDHQLINFKDFKTDISLLLNICPTHLDYHGTYEAYKETKKKIFNNHNSNNIAIINKTNLDAYNITQDIASTKYYFNDSNNYITNEGIYINKEQVINLNDIILKGTHNYENILAMLVLLNILNVDYKYAVEELKEFKGVAHRLEFVREFKGVAFYNDSKATNPVSTVVALKSFPNNVHLIFGGMDRKQEFDDLIPFIPRIKKIYAIGEVRNRVKTFCDTHNIPCTTFVYLKEALEDITKNITPKDTVLLSPGASSWDQYKKFEDRGDEFKEIVNNYS